MALCRLAGNQRWPQLASDSAGGAIVTWIDRRPGANGQYAQRVDADGAPQWTADGVALSTQTVAFETFPLRIVPDGAGGAIVAWEWSELRIAQGIDVQHIDAGGAVRWTTSGLRLYQQPAEPFDPLPIPKQLYLQLAIDGAGGAIAAWKRLSDSFFGASSQLLAQRVDAAGASLWTPGGQLVTTDTVHQNTPAIIADGAGGAIIAWHENRLAGMSNDIFGQRLDGAGAPLWGPGGVTAYTGPGNQSRPRIAPDGIGGALISWATASGGKDNLRLQRLDASGAGRWGAGGVALTSGSVDADDYQMTADGQGGAILTWQDNDNATLYGGRVDLSGAAQWTTGVAVCTVAGADAQPRLAPDGVGDAFFVWRDRRDDAGDIYAQRVRADGLLAPSKPIDLTATPVSSGLIALSWTDNAEDEDGFQIERSDNGGADYAPVATVAANVTAFADAGRQPGKRYFYRARAYNAAANFPYSNIASAKTPATSGTIVYDGFTYIGGAELVGQSGGTGWAGAWSDRYSAAGDVAIADWRAQYVGSGDGNWAAVAREFATPFADGKVYYASWRAYHRAGADWSRTRMYPTFFQGTTPGGETLNIGLVDAAPAPVWTLRANTPSQLRSVGPPIALNQAQEVLVQFVLNGATDSVYCWIDPVAGASGPDMQLENQNLVGAGGLGNEITHVSLDFRNSVDFWIDEFRITTQPPGGAPRNFVATAGDGGIDLSWELPGLPKLAGVRIQRLTGRYPTSPNEGTTVQHGSEFSARDMVVSEGVKYYYMAFSYDAAGTFADAAGANATAPPPLFQQAKRWEVYQ